MPQVQLHLIPTPGAKPEFLADVTTGEEARLPSRIVLEGYTRDAWAWKPHGSWISTETKPLNDRSKQKLQGFVKYLKDRQKCAVGRTEHGGVAVVSYIQSPNKTTLRYVPDASQIPNCNLVVKKKTPQQPPRQERTTSVSSTASSSSASKKKKSGMLGNLLGAQQRTDQHMQKTVKRKQASSTGDGSRSGDAVPQKTAQQVLQEFRSTMEQRMLDFDLEESENSTLVKVNLAEITSPLQGEEKTRVTMDVLKYIVYEQAEEVNEEWVCYKEPSEFMDDITITVYKEAPPEVLEEVNQVELTEEQRGQQWAMQQARRNAMAKEEARHPHHVAELQADDEDLATLNVKKRDRRTIEEIQREMNDPKRTRTDE